MSVFVSRLLSSIDPHRGRVRVQRQLFKVLLINTVVGIKSQQKSRFSSELS